MLFDPVHRQHEALQMAPPLVVHARFAEGRAQMLPARRERRHALVPAADHHVVGVRSAGEGDDARPRRQPRRHEVAQRKRRQAMQPEMFGPLLGPELDAAADRMRTRRAARNWCLSAMPCASARKSHVEDVRIAAHRKTKNQGLGRVSPTARTHRAHVNTLCKP